MTRDEHAARAQRLLWAAVGRLQEEEDFLEALAGSLPDSPEDMLEYREPYDVTAEVEGSIQCCLNDDLRPTIARLKRAAVVAREELKRHWREAQEKRVH